MWTYRQQANPMRILSESLILAALCMLDMLVTVWLVQRGSAIEGNPILRFYLELSLGTFIGVKILLSIGPLIVLERLRHRRPQLVQRLLRVGIVLYLVVYCVGVLRLNVLT
jgi:hypothetical protein